MKHIGKISKVQFGYGGYQDVQLGLSLHFSFGENKGVGTGFFIWPKKAGDSAVEFFQKIEKLLRDSKQDTIENLVDMPVELEFDGIILKDWRFITHNEKNEVHFARYTER